MKRLKLLFLLLPLALMASCHSGAGGTAESPLYKRYASRADMTVAQVCGFRLCDTVTVDVVLLEADDEAAWQGMVEEFGIRDTAGVTSWLADLDDPTVHVEWDGRPVLRVAASFDKRSIGLYRLDAEAQYDALLDYQLNNMQ